MLYRIQVNYINKCKEDYKKQLLNLDETVENNLDRIIKCFGKYSAGKLSAWSHNEGSPWSSVIDPSDRVWGVEIPDETIKNYFNKEIVKDGGQK